MKSIFSMGSEETAAEHLRVFGEPARVRDGNGDYPPYTCLLCGTQTTGSYVHIEWHYQMDAKAEKASAIGPLPCANCGEPVIKDNDAIPRHVHLRVVYCNVMDNHDKRVATMPTPGGKRTFTREKPCTAADLLPFLTAHPDAPIDLMPQGYDNLGFIESVEFIRYPREGYEAIVVNVQ